VQRHIEAVGVVFDEQNLDLIHGRMLTEV